MSRIESELINAKSAGHKRREKPKTLKSIMAAFLAGTAVVTGSGKIMEDNYFSVPQWALTTTQAAFRNCQVDQSDIAEIRQILNRPAEPETQRLYSPQEIDISRLAEKQAKIYSLTLINKEPYSQRIKNAGSVGEIMGNMNEYAEQFGFQVKIPEKTSPGETRTGIRSLSKKVDLEDFRSGAEDFLDLMSLTPKEVIKISGIKEVKIVEMPFEGWSVADKGAIYLSLESFTNNLFYAFSHELFHGIDFNEMGLGYSTDEQYMDTNPAGFSYGQQNGEFGEYTMGRYGEKNIKEDKATLFPYIFPRIRPVVSASPVVEKKAEILLARLQKKVRENEQKADIVSYIRSISS